MMLCPNSDTVGRYSVDVHQPILTIYARNVPDSMLSCRIHYIDFPDCLLLLLSISVFLLFSFFLLFLHFFSCRFRAVDEADLCRLSSAR